MVKNCQVASIFIIILAAIYSYKILREPIRIKTGICFLALGLALYLSESNMITGPAQLAFAFIFLTYTFFLLYQQRSWSALLLLLAGCLVISIGVLADMASEHESISSYLSQPVLNFLELGYEEMFDVVGLGFICLAAITCFLDTIERFMRDNVTGTFCLLTSSGLLTAGNGFLHFQYKRNGLLTVIALIMTIGGFLGLLITNRRINKKESMLVLITEERFYLLVFSFFVVLPVIYGNISVVESLIIWLPALIYLGWYLYHHHPVWRNSDAN